MLFMTIPTAGSHPDLLDALIRDSGLPPSQVILVKTRPGVQLPDDVVVIEDFGGINIQRWWLAGIEAAAERGATAVAVLNDDIRIGADSLQMLESALVSTGATVATPSRPPRKDGVHKGRLVPYSPRIWGCLWMLDASSGLRPDPRYVWWYGDNDLDIRARRDFNGIVSVPVDYEHLHGGEGSGQSPELAEQVKRDAATFHRDYERILRPTRWVNRGRGILGMPPLPF